MRYVDRILLSLGSVLCGVLLAFGLFFPPDWSRSIIATAAGIAGLVFFAWVILRRQRG